MCPPTHKVHVTVSSWIDPTSWALVSFKQCPSNPLFNKPGQFIIELATINLYRWCVKALFLVNAWEYNYAEPNKQSQTNLVDMTYTLTNITVQFWTTKKEPAFLSDTRLKPVRKNYLLCLNKLTGWRIDSCRIVDQRRGLFIPLLWVVAYVFRLFDYDLVWRAWNTVEFKSYSVLRFTVVGWICRRIISKHFEHRSYLVHLGNNVRRHLNTKAFN